VGVVRLADSGTNLCYLIQCPMFYTLYNLENAFVSYRLCRYIRLGPSWPPGLCPNTPLGNQGDYDSGLMATGNSIIAVFGANIAISG